MIRRVRTAARGPAGARGPGRNTGIMLQAGTASSAIAKQQVGHDDGDHDQADGTESPARAHAPLQTPSAAKQQQQDNHDDEQIHVPSPNYCPRADHCTPDGPGHYAARLAPSVRRRRLRARPGATAGFIRQRCPYLRWRTEGANPRAYADRRNR